MNVEANDNHENRVRVPFSFSPVFFTDATANGGLLEPQHRHVIGYDTDSKCVLQLMRLLLGVFVFQGLSEAHDILENEEVWNLPRPYLKAVKQTPANRQKEHVVWSKGLPVEREFGLVVSSFPKVIPINIERTV